MCNRKIGGFIYYKSTELLGMIMDASAVVPRKNNSP